MLDLRPGTEQPEATIRDGRMPVSSTIRAATIRDGRIPLTHCVGTHTRAPELGRGVVVEALRQPLAIREPHLWRLRQLRGWGAGGLTGWGLGRCKIYM
eukprot:SAG31_NODE_2240_length_6111_cov_11.710246_7_plen_98_part_00